MKIKEKLQKFEKYFRRLNLQYPEAKKNMIFKFHETFQEEMKDTETGKKWRKQVYGKEEKKEVLKSKQGWGRSYGY